MTPSYSHLASRIATSNSKEDSTPNYHIAMSPSSTSVIGIHVQKEKLKVKIGHTAHIDASVLPLYAANQTVIWTNVHPHIASVTVQGNRAIITGIQTGQAILLATTEENGFRDLCIVHVQPYIMSPY